MLSIIWSMALAVASLAPLRAVRTASRWYCDLFRSIPLLALLLFAYFGLGSATVRLHISALTLGIAVLVLVESAYLAEVYRGTMQAIPAEQWTAARSLGMKWRQIVPFVILPQFALPATPSTLTMVIGVIKDSSLLSLIAISEVTLEASNLVAQTFQPFPVYLLLAGLYLCMVVPLALVSRYFEVRLSPSQARRPGGPGRRQNSPAASGKEVSRGSPVA